MRYGLLAFLLLLRFAICAQDSKKKPVVFKVRAPLATCKIVCADQEFLLEKESNVQLQIKGRNPSIQVEVKGGKVISEKENTYRVRFLTVGTVVFSVFQLTDRGRILLAVRKMEVKGPQLFFCGLATDSSTKVLRLGACHVYAKSKYFKSDLPLKKFDMLFYDEVEVNGRWKEKVDTLRSDTCRLTPEMRKLLNRFQPKTNKMYFYNLVCSLPDGTIRVLEPVELLGLRDSTTLSARPQCIFLLKKKKV